MATNGPLAIQISKTTGMRFAIALLATIVALLVRLALNPFLGDYVPYITLFPAVAFCAWYCGIGPSILAAVLAIIGARYWFTSPAHSLRIAGTPQVIGLVAFLFVSSVLVSMGEARRRREAVLWAAQRELVRCPGDFVSTEASPRVGISPAKWFSRFRVGANVFPQFTG